MTFPLNDEIAAAFAQFFFGGGSGPSHSTLSRLFAGAGYVDADPYDLNTQAPNKQLDRLNVVIASDLGSEFELGHGLLTPIPATVTPADESEQPISETDAWRSLSKTWDDVLFPQLEDRYSGRPEQLMQLLHVDTAPPTGDYAWTLRASKSGTAQARALAPVRTSELPLDTIKRSFRWLAR